MKKFLKNIILSIMLIAVALTATGCSLFELTNTGGTNPKPSGGLPQSSIAASSVNFNPQSETDRTEMKMVDAVSKVKRAVVAIEMVTSTSGSSGSGVIVDVTRLDDQSQAIDSENVFYILTCHHVVSGGGDITVFVPDMNNRNHGDSDYDQRFAFKGTIDNAVHQSDAIQLVGGDADSDVAVLRLDLTGTGVSKDEIVEAKVPVDSYELKQGETVFAIGNSRGNLPGSVSNGIISYVDREISVGSVGDLVLIQTNAEIYPGNSGGGLFNLYGELIGITNSGVTESITLSAETTSIPLGINYAIPFESERTDNGYINIAKQLIGSATATNFGYVSGRWSIGITIEGKTDRTGSYIQISSIVEGSNASKSQLKEGDILTAVKYTLGGENVTEKVTTSAQLSAVVSTLKKNFSIGDSFTFTVQRVENFNYRSYDIVINLSVQDIFMNTGVN